MINKRDENIDGFTIYEVSCDECSTGSEEFEARSWNHLLYLMKKERWTYEKVDGDWIHACPECAS